MKIGLLVLCITFLLYVLEILPPHVPMSDLPKYWSLPVKEYLEATSINPGWSWLGMLGKADFLNFIGVAFLAGVTIICYVAVIPIFLKKKDIIYFILCMFEVIVLVLAASGILISL